VEERKKGTNPPFFINTLQGKPTLKDPRIMEKTWKKPSQQPIQCWGYGKYHMHRDFPQYGKKERNVHSVQQVVTVEDMERNVPRIYTSLDNKQVVSQSHMIEVEGKINDQPNSILIDSGYILSYIDPNMVERFQLPRSNLGKSWLVQLAIG
jgi:hypothetical protein